VIGSCEFRQGPQCLLDEIERRSADYIPWMDADDELLTPANFRRAFASQYEVFGVQSSAGRDGRITACGGQAAAFAEGRCHEYPTIGGRPRSSSPTA
jgi:hypothetical protein